MTTLSAHAGSRSSKLLWLGLAGMLACAGGGAYGAYVVEPPPPDRFEVVAVAPGPQYVWVPGYWGWSGTTYVWTRGTWAVPPNGHQRWVRGHWRHGDRGWRRIDGRWE